MIETIRKLVEAHGPSGHEEQVRELVLAEIEGLADEIEIDAMGNVIAWRRPESGAKVPLRVMLSAHMDEIAFMVTHVEEAGYLRLLPLGGFDPKTLTAQRVVVHGRDDLLGVLGIKAVHLMSDEEKGRPARLEDYFVDVGLPGARVRELVRPGDVVTREREMACLGDLVTCKSLDNRAGLYVMITAFRALAEHRCEIIAVASVQEEVGLRGARVATARVRPQIGLAIDITLANDLPDASPHERITSLGAGAAIKVYDTSAIVPASIVDHLVALGEERGIPTQLEVMVRGGTDTRELGLSGEGAPAGCVSIPTRYVHQVVETCHPDDLDACVDLVVAFCETAHSLVE